jgi:hypothetical protein
MDVVRRNAQAKYHNRESVVLLAKKVNPLKYIKIEKINSVLERNINLTVNIKAKDVEKK